LSPRFAIASPQLLMNRLPQMNFRRANKMLKRIED
jgi:hypothetical protein